MAVSPIVVCLVLFDCVIAYLVALVCSVFVVLVGWLVLVCWKVWDGMAVSPIVGWLVLLGCVIACLVAFFVRFSLVWLVGWLTGFTFHDHRPGEVARGRWGGGLAWEDRGAWRGVCALNIDLSILTPSTLPPPPLPF